MTLLREGAVSSRDYQKSIARSVLEKGNSLVVLPTGMGKTVIALLVMDEILARGGRVLFLAPTKPLAEQHAKKILECMALGEGDVALLTGETKPGERNGAWESARVVAATPQTVENDVKSGRASVSSFSLVVFDEAHRAVGNYAYTFVAQEAKKSSALTLGLTASPGSSRKKINEIAGALAVENVEARSEEDEDVRDFVKGIRVAWVEAILPPEFTKALGELEGLMRENLEALKRMGYVFPNARKISKKGMLELRKRMLAERHPRKFQGISRLTTLFNLSLAHELLETQSPGAVLDFFERMKERDSKAVWRILSDPRVKRLIERIKTLPEHPKVGRLLEIVSANREKTIIVFVQYRDQVRRIVEKLNSLDGVRASPFIGKRDGVSQKQQKETIEAFRRGDFNVLVASSIGEEGLDIPAVDMVVFYEPIASEIRSIQRRGRAGRAKAGEAIILITKGTRDEAYYWVARRKEKKMKLIVEEIKGRVGGKKERSGQLALKDFF